MKDFLELKEDDIFAYTISNEKNSQSVIIKCTAEISKSELKVKSGSIGDQEFNSFLHDFLKNCKKEYPDLQLLVGKELFGPKIHIVIVDKGQNIYEPEQGFSSYLTAFTSIVERIAGISLFNEFAKKVYARPQLYNYSKIFDEVKKSLPKDEYKVQDKAVINR